MPKGETFPLLAAPQVRLQVRQEQEGFRAQLDTGKELTAGAFPLLAAPQVRLQIRQEQEGFRAQVGYWERTNRWCLYPAGNAPGAPSDQTGTGRVSHTGWILGKNLPLVPEGGAFPQLAAPQVRLQVRQEQEGLCTQLTVLPVRPVLTVVYSPAHRSKVNSREHCMIYRGPGFGSSSPPPLPFSRQYKPVRSVAHSITVHSTHNRIVSLFQYPVANITLYFALCNVIPTFLLIFVYTLIGVLLSTLALLFCWDPDPHPHPDSLVTSTDLAPDP